MPGAGINISSLSRPLDLGNCLDTSSKVSIGKDSAHFYVGVSAKTRDGNLLISGEYYNYWEQSSSSKGFLMKCDRYGNVIWAKLYDSSNHQSYHYLVNYYVTELMDGSILMAGLYILRLCVPGIIACIPSHSKVFGVALVRELKITASMAN